MIFQDWWPSTHSLRSVNPARGHRVCSGRDSDTVQLAQAREGTGAGRALHHTSPPRAASDSLLASGQIWEGNVNGGTTLQMGRAYSQPLNKGRIWPHSRPQFVVCCLLCEFVIRRPAQRKRRPTVAKAAQFCILYCIRLHQCTYKPVNTAGD